MKNLLNFIISLMGLSLLTSCLTSCRGNPQDERIPKGESCLIRSKDSYCINKIDNTTQFKSFAEIRGYECVDMNYKIELETFIYDILDENERLRNENLMLMDGELSYDY
jgi:hypothetical protein